MRRALKTKAFRHLLSGRATNASNSAREFYKAALVDLKDTGPSKIITRPITREGRYVGAGKNLKLYIIKSRKSIK